MHNDPVRNTWRFALTARLLHWSVAVLIVCQLGLGWTMMTMEDDPGADVLFDLHKSIGLAVFALVAVRLAWRLAHPPAPLPASVAPWERILANVVERTLYVCMIAMPLTGYLGASHQKHPPTFFGLPLHSRGQFSETMGSISHCLAIPPIAAETLWKALISLAECSSDASETLGRRTLLWIPRSCFGTGHH